MWFRRSQLKLSAGEGQRLIWSNKRQGEGSVELEAVLCNNNPSLSFIIGLLILFAVTFWLQQYYRMPFSRKCGIERKSESEGERERE